MNSLSPSLDDARWQMLLEQAASLYSDVTLSRGFQYYKQGRVRSYTPLLEHQIVAVVAGSEHYHVKLNADKLSSSRCECPVGSNCKHIVAVLLQYAHRGGRPAAAIVNAKMAGIAAASSAKAAASANRLQPPLQAERLEALPMTQWRKLFEQYAQSLPDARGRSGGEAMLAALQRAKPSSLAQGLNELYDLYAHLFALEKLLESSRTSGYLYSFQFQETLSALTLGISDLLASRSPLEAASPSEPDNDIRLRLTDIAADVRRRMIADPGASRSWLNVYRLLWSTWLKPPVGELRPYAAELEQLLAAESSPGEVRSRLPGQLAKGWMHYYMSQDEQAWAILRGANSGTTIVPSDLTAFLHALAEEEDWSRMQRWLVEIGELLSFHRSLELRVYMTFWNALLERLPDAEPAMWQTLVGMMPASKLIYEDALLEHGKWRQWIDYQLSSGVEPLSHRVTELAPIEKHAPETLLPYYHQAVERYVLAKNRDGYKSAVKLLKRLAKLYKKLKRESRWELFLAAFADRHSRLRALQEELRKGKLLE